MIAAIFTFISTLIGTIFCFVSQVLAFFFFFPRWLIVAIKAIETLGIVAILYLIVRKISKKQ